MFMHATHHKILLNMLPRDLRCGKEPRKQICVANLFFNFSSPALEPEILRPIRQKIGHKTQRIKVIKAPVQ